MYNILYLIIVLVISSVILIRKINIKPILILGYIFLISINGVINTIEKENLIINILYLTTSLIVIYILLKKGGNEEILLVFLAMCGLYILIESTNLLTLFLGLELQAFVGYTLVGSNKTLLGSEAGLKYFLIGAIASALFILGACLIYGEKGVIDYLAIFSLQQEESTIHYIGILLIIIALFFKIGASPFHLWLPDAYTGSSYETLLFISIFPKIFLFVLIKTLQKYIDLSVILIISLVLSLIIGSLQAIKQQKIKRFISYTIIYNNGFFLTLIIVPGYHSDYFQVITLFFYLISSFIIILIFSTQKELSTDMVIQNIRDIQFIKNSNYNYLLPLSISLFALIGIPPMSNFLFKMILFSELLNQGYLMLTIFQILLSILPSFYYLRIISSLHFQPTTKRVFFESTGKIEGIVIVSIMTGIIISIFYLNEFLHIFSL